MVAHRNDWCLSVAYFRDVWSCFLFPYRSITLVPAWTPPDPLDLQLSWAIGKTIGWLSCCGQLPVELSLFFFSLFYSLFSSLLSTLNPNFITSFIKTRERLAPICCKTFHLISVLVFSIVFFFFWSTALGTVSDRLQQNISYKEVAYVEQVKIRIV